MQKNKSTKPKAVKSKFYVDNKALYKDFLENYYPKVQEWYAAGRPGNPPPVTDLIGEAIYKVAKKFCYSRQYFYLTNMHEDLASYAMLITLKYVHNFDPTKWNNPFAYITTLVNNGFLQFIKKETKNNKAKSAMVDKMFFEQMTADNIESDNFITFMKERFEEESKGNKHFEDSNTK